MGTVNDCMVGSRTRTRPEWQRERYVQGVAPEHARETCAVVMRPKVGNEYNKAEALNLMAYMAIVLQIEPRELETAIDNAING